jgi:DNA-binding MarR family transcriptional regulator
MASKPRAAPTPRFYDGRRHVVGESVGYLLNQVVLSMRRQVAQRMAVHELTAAQWHPLWKLKRDGPSTAQEMAREMDIDAGAMTRLIDRMVAKGLVERTRSSSVRRVVTLSLTPEGDAVARCVPAVLAGVNNDYLRDFSSEEWHTLKHLLRKLLANAPTAPVRNGKAAR